MPTKEKINPYWVLIVFRVGLICFIQDMNKRVRVNSDVNYLFDWKIEIGVWIRFVFQGEMPPFIVIRSKTKAAHEFL